MKKGLTDIPMHGALMSNARTTNSDQESKAVYKKKKKNVGYTNAPVQNYGINSHRQQN